LANDRPSGASAATELEGRFWHWLESIDLNTIGFVIVGLFASTWVLAPATWRFDLIEERWSTPDRAIERRPNEARFLSGLLTARRRSRKHQRLTRTWEVAELGESSMRGGGTSVVERRNARQVTRGDGGTRKVSLGATSWSACSDLEVQEWAEHGRRLGAAGRSIGWWIGDWLLYGNERFGEKYSRAARITGYDVQTLMNMVYVASRFDISRRRPQLSFSHHAELAALDPDAQDRWLLRAEADRLSVRCLRQELRSQRKALKESGRLELAAASVDSDEIVCAECGRPLDGDHAPESGAQSVTD